MDGLVVVFRCGVVVVWEVVAEPRERFCCLGRNMGREEETGMIGGRSCCLGEVAQSRCEDIVATGLRLGASNFIDEVANDPRSWDKGPADSSE